MSDADAIEARASQWLGRREFGDWTDDDQREFHAWLDEAPEYRIAFVRLETGWARTARLAALRSSGEEQKPDHAARAWRLRTRILAGLTFAVVLAAGAALFAGRSVQTAYATSVGGHRTITLGDGTLVELNTDTMLHVSMSARNRVVLLDHGEAYFQVRHDNARPFTVMAADHRVVDLGTKFVVRNDSGSLEVSLLEGRARFESADAKTQSAILSPGDVVIAKGSSLSLTKTSTRELDGGLSWRQGLLVFKHTALADAAAEFNRYNRDKLVIADASVARLQIRGTFRTNDIVPFANVARDVLGLHVVRRGEDIVVTR
jgi:transmembrane sensor